MRLPVSATSRRALLVGAGLVLPGLAWAQDTRLGERAIGKDDAPVTVTEFFSLTCSHCAAFAKEVYPQIRDLPGTRQIMAAAAE